MSPQDIGEYCRRVEDHLTRANAGHLVRIVGPGFDLVRGWARSRVPLSVVYRGIDLKAERHREGQARRPLRIEFCESDVRAIFDQWRRAIGLTTGAGFAEDPGSEDPGLHVSSPDGAPGPGDGAPGLQTRGDAAEPKRPSLGRHLERAIDRLSRVAGRLDLPDGLRDACDRALQALAALRESSARARGAAREEAVATLAALDAELLASARAHAPAGWLEALDAEAAADLAPFRGRLVGDAWQRSITVTVDRLLRNRLGLPHLQL